MQVENGSVRCVGGVVYDERGRLLLVQRANEPGRGTWSLPGGKIEPGETDAQAVIREMLEETALRVVPGALAGRLVLGPYEVFDYHCEVAEGTPRAGSDALDLRWVGAADFAGMERTGEVAGLIADTLRDWGVAPQR